MRYLALAAALFCVACAVLVIALSQGDAWLEFVGVLDCLVGGFVAGWLVGEPRAS